MDFKLFFGIISVILEIICFFTYVKDIFARKTSPHMYTWLLWTILQSVGIAAMFKGGAYLGVLGLTVGSLFCFFIFILSFKYGTKNITRFDTFCLFGAIIIILVWLLQHNALLSVILVTVVDVIAFLPTYRKGYAEPKSETVSTFLLSAASQAFSLLALASYSLTTTLYLSDLVITNGAFALILIFRRRMIKMPLWPK
jgi:hypothetical protein